MNTETSELKNASNEVRAQNGKADNAREVVWEPRADIAEVDDDVLLYVDLPGVRWEDVDIRLENRELQVRGKATPPGTKPNFLLKEYAVGDYYRAFSVTDDIDAEKIRADLKDGVLTVHLPKADALKRRRIPVNG